MIDGGVIPGMSVRVDGNVVARGLYLEQACAIAFHHQGEVWGFGKSASERFPECGWSATAKLAYMKDGELVKTDEWRSVWDRNEIPGRQDQLRERLRKGFR